jgi:hypothetical protein
VVRRFGNSASISGPAYLATLKYRKAEVAGGISGHHFADLVSFPQNFLHPSLAVGHQYHNYLELQPTPILTFASKCRIRVGAALGRGELVYPGPDNFPTNLQPLRIFPPTLKFLYNATLSEDRA